MPSNVSRGAMYNDRFGEMYRVNGTSLYRIDANGTATDLGIISGSDLVAMPYSFNTQGIVANKRFWLYSPDDGLQEVTDPDLGDPIDCVWVDGYYFFTDGEYIYHTDITDETAIDPLKFATAEFMPDATLGVAKTQDNKVMVFGRYSIEYFSNVAAEDFAFSRLATRAIKIGIVGTHAKCEVDGVYYILGNRKEEAVGVHVVTVGQSQYISSREVEKVIAQYTEAELRQVRLEAIHQDEMTFVLIHLPNHTLQFNETLAGKAGKESAWTILSTGSQEGIRNYRGIHFAFDPRLSKWTVGDKENGNLGIWDNTTALQYDEIAEWRIFTPYADLERGSVDEVEIETIPGFTSESDATVFMSITYDGVFWGKEWTLGYGTPGDYGKRFIARRLGYIRDKFAIKLRGATRSRMLFSRAKITYG